MGLSPRTRTADDASKGPKGLPRSVAAVICTVGTRATLTAALRSLAAELDDLDELIVVVDGGPLTIALPDLPIKPRIERQPASGVAAARQRALECVASELVLFIDDDETVHAGWRAAMTAPFHDE